jgi:amidase
MKHVRSIVRVSSLLVGAALVATLAATSVAVVADHGPHGTFDLVEATIPSIHQAFDRHIITPQQLVSMYMKRIAAFDGKTTAAHLNAYMFVNPHPLAGFDDRDAFDDRGRDDDDHHGQQPLWGIPIILKDNVDTRDMPTTAGSVALVGSFPRTDAFVARRLREAGAIILGKATMTEFANFLTNGMPAGYSSHGSYGFNPFDPRPDPRMALDGFGRPFDDGRPALTPGGSSSGPGIAVSANLAAVGIGTETSGSILSPGTANGIVGIKPTVGLVSRDGVVPIAADQDTAGPFGRTVTDAAIVLGVIAGFDPNDPATAACLTPGNCFHDYTQFLNKHALNGAASPCRRSRPTAPT